MYCNLTSIRVNREPSYAGSFPKLLLLTASLLLALQLGAQVAAQDFASSPPPEPYVGVSTILALPDFIPGAGALFIDPDNAPVGPWLSYGNDGSLVEVLFMVTIANMQAAEDWVDLASGLLAQLDMSVDHVDVTYNAGHPGMTEPHYHIRLVFVDHDTQESLLVAP